MSLAVQLLHTTLVLQQLQRRLGQGAPSGETAGLVEDLGRSRPTVQTALVSMSRVSKTSDQ